MASPIPGAAGGRAAAPSSSGAVQPLLGARVRAGFPSPADDHLDVELDLHAHVVRRPASTYFVRAEGDSMLGDGMHDGDLLVVDRSLEPLPGRVVIIAVDGEPTVSGWPGAAMPWCWRPAIRATRPFRCPAASATCGAWPPMCCTPCRGRRRAAGAAGHSHRLAAAPGRPQADSRYLPGGDGAAHG